MEVFLNLSNDMLKELVPEVGIRYKLNQKIQQLQNQTLFEDLTVQAVQVNIFVS